MHGWVVLPASLVLSVLVGSAAHANQYSIATEKRADNGVQVTRDDKAVSCQSSSVAGFVFNDVGKEPRAIKVGSRLGPPTATWGHRGPVG